MIDIYFRATPNGHKITIFCEEAGLPYKLIPLNHMDQFRRWFLELSPNNKMSVIVDHAPVDGGAPLSVFESGAILVYLAEKVGKFLPINLRDRLETFQWLFWQVASLGPISGQNAHFDHHAKTPSPYATERFHRELGRLYAVADHRLADREFAAGSFSIADMAIYPWIAAHGVMKYDLDAFPNLKRYADQMGERVLNALMKRAAPPHRLMLGWAKM